MTLPSIIIIALTVFLEAAGEPKAGRFAVAEVIATRAQERGISAGEVCLQPWQFSPWNVGQDAVIARHLAGQIVRTEAERRVWRECLQLAAQIEAGQIDKGRGFNHFFNPVLCNPAWADKLQDAVRIGNHIFGRL